MRTDIEHIEEVLSRLRVQVALAEIIVGSGDLVYDPGSGERRGLKHGEFMIGDFIIRDLKARYET